MELSFITRPASGVPARAVSDLLPVGTRTINFRGKSFSFPAFEATAETFKNLKLGPTYFVRGINVLVPDHYTFQDFCRATFEASALAKTPPAASARRIIEIKPVEMKPQEGIDSAVTGAIYPLSVRGELDAVRREEIPHLSPASRTVILREGYSELELKHELLHDIFMGRRFSPEMRRNFILLLIGLVKQAYLQNDRSSLKFFEEVNGRCKIPCRIEEIKELDTYNLRASDEIGPNLFTFANESFVYALELMLGHPDPNLGELPRDLGYFLRHYQIGRYVG